MKLRVRYSNRLFIEISGCSVEAFLKTSTWKIRLPKAKRYFSHVDGNAVVFESNVPRRDCEAIVHSLCQVMQDSNTVMLDASYKQYIEKENARLEEHSSVGLAIKAQSVEIRPAFEEYSDVVNQLMIRPLRERQLWDSFFMCAMKKSANFSVPGSGKTASTLGAYAYLRSRGLVDKVVVVSPKSAFGSWREEWGNCFGRLDICRSLCFHDADFANKPIATKRRELSLNVGRYNLVLLNYEAIGAYVDELREIVSHKTLLVFDEVHKVKRIGGVRAGNAMDIARDAEYVITLTGTPIPNSYSDIYNLLHILFPDDYDGFFGFRQQVLEKPSETDVAAINDAINPFFCRTNKTSLGVPEASPDIVIKEESSYAENELFLRVKEAYRRDALALIIRIMQMESDPEMILDALEPSDLDDFFNEEPLPLVDSEPAPDSLVDLVRQCRPTSKTRRCIELASELLREGKPVIIWCYFKKSMSNLERLLSALGWRVSVINGSSSQIARDSDLADFKNGLIDVLITNPHTLAESVSLHSICHDAIYYEYSYNLIHLLQSKDRIHRLGLPAGQYTQYYYLQSSFTTEKGDWSLGERIYMRLREKEQVMLDAIDRGILEPGVTEAEDIRLVFEGLFDSADIKAMRH